MNDEIPSENEQPVIPTLGFNTFFNVPNKVFLFFAILQLVIVLAVTNKYLASELHLFWPIAILFSLVNFYSKLTISIETGKPDTEQIKDYADQIYFLGFFATLLTLGLSMTMRESMGANFQVILNLFGWGLLTTGSSVLLRVLTYEHAEDIEHSLDAEEKSILEDFTNKLRTVSIDFHRLSGELVDNIEPLNKSVRSLAESIKSTLEQAATASNSHLKTLQERLEALDESDPTVVIKKFDEIIKKLSNLEGAEKFSYQITQLNSDLETLRNTINKISIKPSRNGIVKSESGPENPPAPEATKDESMTGGGLAVWVLIVGGIASIAFLLYEKFIK